MATQFNAVTRTPPKILTGFAIAFLLSHRFAIAQSAFDVKVGDATVEAAAVNDSAFRLTVSYAGTPTPAHSIFLAGNPTPSASTIVTDGPWQGVKTSAGELLIDPADALWTLRDPQGKTLIPPGPIAESTHNIQTQKPFLILNLGCDSTHSFEVYGCGDGADSLLQKFAQPGLGNGHATVPYFWNSAGYAALGVSSDDNDPPGWTASSQLGRVSWVFAGTSADLYLMPAPTLQAASRAYAQLSGPPVVPPRWTFGYLQSRWGWKDRAYIEDTLHQFLSRKLPVDAFIFDFEWFTTSPDYTLAENGRADYTDFSFNPKLFPDPATQIAAMKSSGVHFVGIRKPRLGNSALLQMARSKNWILAAGKSGEGIDARCLDFANPAVRAWYAQQTIPLLKQGVDGWWDDEGEITYSQYYWWNQAQADALRQVDPNARLWTIDRAFAPGNQRLGASAWSGDIRASWLELLNTPTHLLNWSLAGMPFVACDIGGFYGQTNAHLLTRWMEAGVFFPIMRAHSVDRDIPHFPWLFGTEAESAIRKALDLRYRLIPYIYSLAHESHDTGLPIMRPLAMEFPNDARCQNTSDEWLLGPNLLAAPILDDTDSRRVYLPWQGDHVPPPDQDPATQPDAGQWFKLGGTTPLRAAKTVDAPAKLDEIPIYVRAGTILPLGPVIQQTADLPGGPLEIQIYPGRDAQFTLTEDDGITTAYLKGIVRHTNFAWNDQTRTLSWTIEGPYAGKDIFTDITISLMNPTAVEHAAASITSNGQTALPQ